MAVTLLSVSVCACRQRRRPPLRPGEDARPCGLRCWRGAAAPQPLGGAYGAAPAASASNSGAQLHQSDLQATAALRSRSGAGNGGTGAVGAHMPVRPQAVACQSVAQCLRPAWAPQTSPAGAWSMLGKVSSEGQALSGELCGCRAGAGRRQHRRERLQQRRGRRAWCPPRRHGRQGGRPGHARARAPLACAAQRSATWACRRALARSVGL